MERGEMKMKPPGQFQFTEAGLPKHCVPHTIVLKNFLTLGRKRITDKA